MKRLLAGTALLTVCIPMISYAAGADNIAPPVSPDAASRVQVAPEGAKSALSPDVITHESGVDVISADALSAYYLNGVDVAGPDGKSIAKINDVVFDDAWHAQRAIIAVGGVAGIGAKNVGVDFSSLGWSGHDVKKPVVKVDMNEDGLKALPTVDKDKIGSGQVLASSLLGHKVKLQDGDETARISDLILDRNGVARYAAIDFGGVLGVGDKRVAVAFNKLGTFTKDQPITLQDTKAGLAAAPAFVYSIDESTASVVSTPDRDAGSPAAH